MDADQRGRPFREVPGLRHLIDCRDLAEVMEHEGPAPSAEQELAALTAHPCRAILCPVWVPHVRELEPPCCKVGGERGSIGAVVPALGRSRTSTPQIEHL
jgi:hypothetical protein